jgi:phosphoribosylaminoimidazole carboxylase PurK protein
MKTIGIVGGGQLGRMLTDAAHTLGYAVTVLDPTPNSPAGQVADKQIVGDFKDATKIAELAQDVDYVTFEIELADAEALAVLQTSGAIVNPTAATLRQIKNKYEQKKFFKEHGLPVGEFERVHDIDEARAFGTQHGYPYLLKACLDSYDGRGNFVVHNESMIEQGFATLGRECYAEKFVPFVKELAVIVIRDVHGAIATYDTVETVHKNNICHTVTAPAPVDAQVHDNAQKVARDIVALFEGAGVFGVELFLTTDNDVLINEIAPRVHNSGHHTIEYAQTSQFENHIRAITGMPLGSTAPVVPAAVMINILGDRTGPAEPTGLAQAEALGGVRVHVYGKHDTKPERKMGHITVTGDTAQDALHKAQQARALVSI